MVKDWCLLSYLGNTTVGVHSLFVEPDTGVHPFTHVAIYTLSSLVEQSTPMALKIFDENASVSDIRFIDEDLDPVDLGGFIAWTPPVSLQRVTFYHVDLATETLAPTSAERSQIGFVPVGTNEILAPAETEPLHFTRFVVYTQSSLVEQTTPVGRGVQDLKTKFPRRRTRSVFIRNLSFFDYDLDEGDLYGDLLWEAPDDDYFVLQYHIYMAENSTGRGRSSLGVVPKGVHNISVLAETPLLNYTHFLIYTASALAEQTTPVALLIFDAVASVSDLQFEDRDLDPLEIGGNISWSAPLVDERVKLYRTPLPAAPFMVVYTESELIEQSHGVSLTIVDHIASVENITFPDFDLDQGDLGGESATTRSLHPMPKRYNSGQDFEDTSPATNGSLAWCRFSYRLVDDLNITVPVETKLQDFTHFVISTVSLLVEQSTPAEHLIFDATATDYLLYFSWDPLGNNRSRVGDIVPVGTDRILLPAEIAQGPHEYLVIYTRSFLVEQTTPAYFALSDTRSIPSDIVLMDLDLDYSELGGNISWVSPLESAQVTEYYIYLGDSYGYVLVYASSSLAEQTTPAAHIIYDANASVSNVNFVGKDLDLEEPTDLGGYVSWVEPASDLDRVMAYSVYLSLDDIGTGRSKVEQDVLVGSNELLVPPETPRQSFTRFVVYTRSTLVEQSTPTAHLLFDTTAMPQNLDFLDIDVDRGEMGGNLTWMAPTDPTHVTEYVLYLGENAHGLDRSILGNVSWDTFEFFVPLNTLILNFTHLLVYSKSDLAEMTTPAALLIRDSIAEWPPGDLAVAFPGDTDITGMTWIGVWITAFGVEQQTPSVTQVVDTISSVGFVKFADEDLDALQLAGTISWGPPAEITYNQDYVIYFAQSETGTARSLVGVVPLGTNSLAVPLDTYFSQFTHFVVYTRSIAYEQSTPLGVQLYDHNGLVQNLAFSDNDLDENMLGGLLQWTLPADTSAVQQYNIYFTFTADQFDPLFRRDIVALGLSPSATHQMLPLGTSKISADGLEEVSCNLTAADAVLSVFYNGSDLSNYHRDEEWSNTKKFSFLKVPGAYLVISASSMLTADWCSPTENICVAGTFNQGLNYCSVAGFSLECSDGVTAGDIGWEAYGSSIDVDSLHQAGGGTGWSTTCASESNFYLIENSLSAKIWASAGLASIGGEVRWNPVGDIQLASAYSVYLATDSSGADRSLLGTSPVGTTVLTVPQGTLLTQNFTHVVIYVESFLVQQRLPAWSLFLVDEYEGLCESDVCGFGGGQPTRVGSCTTAAGCSDCDLNPLRIQTITTAIAGDMVLITTEAGTDVFNFWSKLSSCGVTILDVHYYKAIGPTTPSTTDTTVSFQCRFSCLPGADCQTCVAAEQGIVSGTTVDDDGYSVWRYLACAFRGLSNAADSELTYSYVFSKGVYLGSAAEAAITGCEPYIMAIASEPPFQLASVNVGCTGLACELK
eukprot:g16119.t1